MFFCFHVFIPGQRSQMSKSVPLKYWYAHPEEDEDISVVSSPAFRHAGGAPEELGYWQVDEVLACRSWQFLYWQWLLGTPGQSD